MFLDVVIGIISFILLVVGKLAFIWAPILLMYLAYFMWENFITDRFILGMSWTLFEVQVPRDVEKTPMAMELILTNAMYHASVKGGWEVWVQGAPHFWFSLELVGIDGEVRFYVRTPSRIRDLVETQIYAQYPQAKVREAEDYSLLVPYNAPNNDWYIWGCEWTLKEHDAIPIRTYKDYGLDEPSDKEHQKVDPITPMIEFLGSLKKGQQVWIQHVIRPSKKTWKTKGKPFTSHGWIDEANAEMDRQQEPYRKYSQRPAGAPNPEVAWSQEVRLPRTVEKKINLMKEKIQKLGFDVGMRLVAVSDARYVSLDEFNGLRRAVRLMYRQFNNPDGNSIVRINATQFDQPFADPTGAAIWKLKNRLLNWYRGRTFFHPPIQYSIQYPFPLDIFFPSKKSEIHVFNVEEIATIYHFPGQVSQTPSFRRIESRVAKPPANLPI